MSKATHRKASPRKPLPAASALDGRTPVIKHKSSPPHQSQQIAEKPQQISEVISFPTDPPELGLLDKLPTEPDWQGGMALDGAFQFPMITDPGLERQTVLRAAVQDNLATGHPPYTTVHIQTLGELAWILRDHQWSGDMNVPRRQPADLSWAQMSQTNLQRVRLYEANLEGAAFNHANLSHAQLEKANLNYAQLQQAHLNGARLGEATLLYAQLGKANLQQANLWAAKLLGARLEEANLAGARLADACFQSAHLEHAQLQGSDLSHATLQNAYLEGADLSGADLRGTNLCGADLRRAKMDGSTRLEGVQLDTSTRLVDVLWNGAPLAQIDWQRLPQLGDEVNLVGLPTRQDQVKACLTAVQTYQQLAVALRTQGLNEVADRFAYRAQFLRRVLIWLETGLPMPGFKQRLALLKAQPLPQLWQQRKQLPLRRAWRSAGQLIHQQGKQWRHELLPQTLLARLWQRPAWEWGIALLLLGLAVGISLAHWWSGLVALLGISLVLLGLRQPRGRKLLAYLFSLLLDVLAGYGYRPGRALGWYLAVTSGFALVYATLGHLPFFPDACVLSLTSFHGRGFFPGLGTTPSLHNPLVVGAALEAVIGLFIEISFIATFTQRFFGR